MSTQVSSCPNRLRHCMKTWLKKNAVTVLLVAIALVGVGLLAYPSVANWYNQFHQSRAIATYSEAVSGLNKEDYEKLLAKADRYNADLAKSGPLWHMTTEQEQRYESVLTVDDSKIMGYINIPKIRVRLPIYHGTEESVLQVAIGHIQGSSLPVGGKSSHCIVSGHRGLPSATLFTDLDKMVVGDTWTMTCLGRTVTYECDAVHIVEPDDFTYLGIEKGKDRCTLVTCTPYGINTHRLLVTGHRVANAQGDALIPADALIIEPIYIAPVVAVPILVMLLISFIAWTRRQRLTKSKDQAVSDYVDRVWKR